MEGRVGHRRGGILGLAQLIEQHGEAIEYELLSRGLRLDDLGTKRLTWRDLKVVLRHLPHGNALARERLGDGAYWTADTYLLALIGDALQGANWQRAGDKHAQRPRPIPRPGDRASGKTFGRGSGIPIDEMRKRLGWE